VDVVFEAAGTETRTWPPGSAEERTWPLQLGDGAGRLNISRWHDDNMNIRTTCVMHVNTPYERFAWTDRLLAPYWKGLIQVKPLLTDLSR
jgi:hypothetical protein